MFLLIDVDLFVFELSRCRKVILHQTANYRRIPYGFWIEPFFWSTCKIDGRSIPGWVDFLVSFWVLMT